MRCAKKGRLFVSNAQSSQLRLAQDASYWGDANLQQLQGSKLKSIVDKYTNLFSF